MIKEVYFKKYSFEWHDWRRHHIGGSDISAVCAGYNSDLAQVSWTPPLKYYLSMIGEAVQPFMGNVPSNMGQVMEPVIAGLYRYFDRSIPPEPDTSIPLMEMFENRSKGKRFNRIICRPNYVWNEAYPHMSASPDGFIYESRGRGILEIKNMTSMEQNRYANKINPSHMLQCQHNMLCSGSKYCDLIRLIDGTWLDVIRFEANPEIHDFIIKCAGDFWSRVTEARTLKTANNIDIYYDLNEEFFTEDQLIAVGMLQSMEPDFIGSDAELKWLKEYIKPITKTIVNDHKKDVNITQAKLIKEMKGYQVVNAQAGYYSYKNTSNGVPRFYITPKLLEAI
jgi:hypothetical protein